MLLALPLAMAGNLVRLPNPDQYPAKPLSSGKVAKPIITSKLAKLFRTQIRRGALAGPNFAGHYTVVTWGCGMDAYMLVVVDAITGKVYEPPFGCMTLAGGYNLPIAGLEADANPGFRLDSKLLLTVGVKDGNDASPDDRAATFYVFDRGRFKRIHREPALLD